ncbi:MAG: CvpA family protein, partial [Flavobacteriales bacterium]
YLPLLTFITTFLIIVLIVHLIGRTIEKFIELISLKFIDRLFGAVFSILKTGLIIGVLFDIYRIY